MWLLDLENAEQTAKAAGLDDPAALERYGNSEAGVLVTVCG